MTTIERSLAAAWPGPLHEFNGRGVLYLDADATPEQREALETIAAGRAGGPIGIFMSTVNAGLEVRTASIEFNWAGKESSFRVPGQLEVAFSPMLNPVTGGEHHATLLLPTGLLTRREEFYSAHDFSVDTGEIRFEHPGRNAIAFTHTWRGA